MPALSSTATLAADDAFRRRVQAAMMTTALQVAGEELGAHSEQQRTLREALAAQVFATPAVVLDRFAWATAVNPTILGTYEQQGGGVTAEPVADGDLLYVVSAVWDDLSGASAVHAQPVAAAPAPAPTPAPTPAPASTPAATAPASDPAATGTAGA